MGGLKEELGRGGKGREGEQGEERGRVEGGEGRGQGKEKGRRGGEWKRELGGRRGENDWEGDYLMLSPYPSSPVCGPWFPPTLLEQSVPSASSCEQALGHCVVFVFPPQPLFPSWTLLVHPHRC